MAELSQTNAPIYEALRKFRRMRVVPFDVPGHKRGRGNMELTDSMAEALLCLIHRHQLDIDGLILIQILGIGLLQVLGIIGVVGVVHECTVDQGDVTVMKSPHRIEQMRETVDVFIEIFQNGSGMAAHDFDPFLFQQDTCFFRSVEFISDAHLPYP